MSQLLVVRWFQERSGEMLGALEQAVEQNPDISAYRPVLAALYCDVGRAEEGGAILEKAFEEGFASVPRDFLWLATMNRWAEVAVESRATDAAEALYEMLAEALAAGRELDIPRIVVRAEALLASAAAST